MTGGRTPVGVSGVIDQLTDRLDPISLPELMDVAALTTRTDRKYLVPVAELDLVTDGIASDLNVLDIDGTRGFHYRSRYFDTAGLDSFRSAATCRRRRFKVRTRSYLDTGESMVEVKTRGPRGATVKDRTPAWQAEDLDGPAQGFVAATLAARDVDLAALQVFRPSLDVRYRRVTVLHRPSASRVTIDTSLAWELPEGASDRRELNPGLAIVETKTASSACAIDRALWSRGHRPIRVSKYATGLAIIRGDLPMHRWMTAVRRIDS